MKNKNLKLSDLKVQSFVTSLEKPEKATIQGGDPIAVSPITVCGVCFSEASCFQSCLQFYTCGVQCQFTTPPCVTNNNGCTFNNGCTNPGHC